MSRCVGAVEALEDFVELFDRDGWPLVCYADDGVFLSRRHGQLNGRAWSRMVERIRCQVADCSSEQGCVGENGCVPFHVDVDPGVFSKTLKVRRQPAQFVTRVQFDRLDRKSVV